MPFRNPLASILFNLTLFISLTAALPTTIYSAATDTTHTTSRSDYIRWCDGGQLAQWNNINCIEQDITLNTCQAIPEYKIMGDKDSSAWINAGEDGFPGLSCRAWKKEGCKGKAGAEWNTMAVFEKKGTLRSYMCQKI